MSCREEVDKEVAEMDKNKTNAIGPIAPGASGCVFNGDPPSLSAKEETEKPKEYDKNKTNAVGPLPRGAPGCAFNGD